jgi:hypothetical protein
MLDTERCRRRPSRRTTGYVADNHAGRRLVARLNSAPLDRSIEQNANGITPIALGRRALLAATQTANDPTLNIEALGVGIKEHPIDVSIYSAVRLRGPIRTAQFSYAKV